MALRLRSAFHNHLSFQRYESSPEFFLDIVVGDSLVPLPARLLVRTPSKP